MTAAAREAMEMRLTVLGSETAANKAALGSCGGGHGHGPAEPDTQIVDHNSSEKASPIHLTLIHPPQRISSTNLVSSVTIPPLGLAYLAASVEDAGHRVNVVDAVGEALDHVFTIDGRALRGLAFEAIVRRIDPNTDLIGVGMMFSCAWPSLRELVRQIKERFPETPLVLGGEHPTAMVETVFAQSPVDYVVMGEGEDTLVEICHAVASARPFHGMAGLAYRSPAGVTINPRRGRIRDIDRIPLPAWRHFPVEAYIQFRQPHGSAEGRSMPMLATRGCPFQCTFCGSPGMWGTTWRPRDPKLVVDEIEFYVQRYQADDFQFEDLTAIIRKDWVMAFAEEVQRRRLKISWQLPSGTRSEAIDAEVAKAMYASGCRQFTYALESGSTEVLTRIKKHIKLDRAFESAKLAIAEGIRVQAGFIYGYPHETWRQMWQTYRTILRCALNGFHEVSICALQPLPNTEMYRQINAERPIAFTDEYLDSIFGYLGLWQQKSWNPRIPNFVLRAIIFLSFASFFAVSFFRRPTRGISFMIGLFGSRTEGKLARIIKGLWRNARQSSPHRTSPAHSLTSAGALAE